VQFFSVPVWPAEGTVSCASAQVGWHGATLVAVPGTVDLGFVIALVLIAVVVVPAVWSKRAYRRTAAQTVLDKLLQFIIRVLRIWRS
jgi:hypothetical protein